MFEESERQLFSFRPQMKVFDKKKFPIIIFSKCCQNISCLCPDPDSTKYTDSDTVNTDSKHWFLVENWHPLAQMGPTGPLGTSPPV
jgi:hypothetical protein